MSALYVVGYQDATGLSRTFHGGVDSRWMFRDHYSGTLGKMRRCGGRSTKWTGASRAGIVDGFDPITEGASHLSWGGGLTDERNAGTAIRRGKLRRMIPRLRDERLTVCSGGELGFEVNIQTRGFVSWFWFAVMD